LNTSDTLAAALTGVTRHGERVEVHLSTLDPAAVGPVADQTQPDPSGYPAALRSTRSRWIVEVRTGGGPGGALGGEPSEVDRAAESIRLAGGGVLRGVRPTGSRRLWSAELVTPVPLLGWLTEHGDPIRYRYVSARWPLSAYRTTYADTPGSAEMPSAGRAITPSVLHRLHARGVRVAGLLLHTGVSSLEAGDGPHQEWFEVPAATAAAVADTRAAGGRVVAVGTTVVRALESAAAVADAAAADAAGGPLASAPESNTAGGPVASAGWTDLVITPERGVHTVDGLLTGWHEPAASHLLMLAAVAGRRLLVDSYAEALRAGYRWHEFGDLHLLLPR
jgi:S-adenosylmethionine:tRNA ribosyltransferase-isomerase